MTVAVDKGAGVKGRVGVGRNGVGGRGRVGVGHYIHEALHRRRVQHNYAVMDDVVAFLGVGAHRPNRVDVGAPVVVFVVVVVDGSIPPSP